MLRAGDGGILPAAPRRSAAAARQLMESTSPGAMDGTAPVQPRRVKRLPDPPALRPVGLPEMAPGRMGLEQLTLRTTRRYRLFGSALLALALAIAFGLPMMLDPGQSVSMGFRLVSGTLVVLAAWHLLWALLWRLTYDSIGLSNRNRWLRPEARMWRSLTAISSDGPFITLFYFADGLVMRIPRAIAQREGLMQTARSWLHHDDGTT